jgi:CBS domain-containing protein
MTPNPITVSPDSSVRNAARLMLQDDISGLPVVDAAGQLVGIVSEGDLLRRIEAGTERHRPRWLEFLTGPGQLAEEYARSHGRKIEEVMTRDVVTVSTDAPLEEVVRLMERKHIKRLPVLDGTRLVGIISRANLLHVLASVAEELPPVQASDESIREKIRAEFERLTWAPRRSITVVVRRGIVSLWGVILDERERQALCVAAENVAGVREVRDHLVGVIPVFGTAIAVPPPRRKGRRSRAKP